MQEYLPIIVSCLAALFVQFRNMNKLNRKFIENGQFFKRSKYWAAEQFSIYGTIVFIAIFCITFPSAIAQYKISMLMVYVYYALAGGIGNAGFTYFLGGSEKKLKSIIDKQLNDDEPKNP